MSPAGYACAGIAAWMISCAALCVNERRLLGPDRQPNMPKPWLVAIVLAWPAFVLLALLNRAQRKGFAS